MRDVAAVILAAGGSSRLGRPKQLVLLDGVPLVARAVAVANEAGCRPVVVVVGRDVDACVEALRDTPAVVRVNPTWAAGMGTSIRAGFAALPPTTTRAFLMLCDQPRVTADTLHRLEAAQNATGRPVCVAAFHDVIGPPIIVSGAAIERLRKWPERDGAKRLWLDEPEHVCRVPCPEAADDVDTEDDVARLIDDSPALEGR